MKKLISTILGFIVIGLIFILMPYGTIFQNINNILIGLGIISAIYIAYKDIRFNVRQLVVWVAFIFVIYVLSILRFTLAIVNDFGLSFKTLINTIFLILFAGSLSLTIKNVFKKRQ